MNRTRLKRNRLWWVSLGLSGTLALSAALMPLINWADELMEGQGIVQTQQPTPEAMTIQPSILDADLIRVGLSDNGMTEQEYPHATISATGPFQVKDKASGEVLLSESTRQALHISHHAGGFVLSNGLSQFGPYSGNLQVVCVNPEDRLMVLSVTRKGKIPEYRGIFELTPGYSGADKFSLVNVLPMQDYLKAVVPNELPIRFGYEAVKAQAIAARNYAIHPREKPWPQFDICDSQFCQAYYGANTEQPQTTRALKRTQGIVALYHGDPILALYSSSHGGYAESYENAFSDPKTNQFPATPLPYLKGGPDEGTFTDLSKESAAEAFYTDPKAPSYDVLSPFYRWHQLWSRSELEQTLNHTLAKVSKDSFTKPFVSPLFLPGQTIGHLEKLTVLERGVSGKIMKMQIVGTHGTWTIEKEFVIRKVLPSHGRMLPSANVVFLPVVNKQGQLTAIRVYGGGFGHGVGMSQFGASYMSRHGASFHQILQHYYKGIALGTVPLQASPGHGMKTRFFVTKPQGKLHLVTSSALTAPIHLAINQHELTVTPDPHGELTVPIQADLIPDGLNELTLFPLASDEGVVKAWIEVFEPTSESTLTLNQKSLPDKE